MKIFTKDDKWYLSIYNGVEYVTKKYYEGASGDRDCEDSLTWLAIVIIV